MVNEIERFVNSKLSYITGDLKIGDYMIGGSVALELRYDISIRNSFKDIDVIVKQGTIGRIRPILKNSPFYEIVDEFRAYMDEYSNENEHIEIKTLKGFPVDFIEVPRDAFDEMFEKTEPNNEGIRYCPLIDIIRTKNKWARDKDLEDLYLIEQRFENVGIDFRKEKTIARRQRMREEAKERRKQEEKEAEELKQEVIEYEKEMTCEEIDQMFDELAEMELEERLKKGAPYGLTDPIKFIGVNCETRKRELAEGFILSYNKMYGKVSITKNLGPNESKCYEVDKWLIDLFK